MATVMKYLREASNKSSVHRNSSVLAFTLATPAPMINCTFDAMAVALGVAKRGAAPADPIPSLVEPCIRIVIDVEIRHGAALFVQLDETVHTFGLEEAMLHINRLGDRMLIQKENRLHIRVFGNQFRAGDDGRAGNDRQHCEQTDGAGQQRSDLVQTMRS